MSRSLFAFWDVLSCCIHFCVISPIFFGSFPYMNRSFHIRQFCPIPGSWTSILHYGTCQISCLFLYSHDIVNLCHCDMYFYIFIGGFFFSASIIMHSTVFRISVSHYHRGNSRFQREKDF